MSDLYRGLKKDQQPSFRTENFGRLLLVALNNWQQALVEGLQAKGFEDVRTSHISLLRHIDMDGTRITEIAERAGISKQAVGQLVTICKALDLVMTETDPSDRRAKIVTFTEHGRRLIHEQQAIIEATDNAVRAKIGDKDFEKLRRQLAMLSDWPET
ncbi:MAG: winged helix-turn-helix transcriptional regulator [Rhodospirillales bacterium]|nr:winged helix-turn-helix transcriptional regulator [Rhodospirillales bacterium]